jgi:predicted ATP-grasp superfamily ATP-dependent carboligase/folate-dependent phosphoribosylglycinamide formyltransferase PurN
MNIVVLTNDNFFSFTVLKEFLEKRKNDIKLIVFSSALVGKLGTTKSIGWSFVNTGLRHTIFKVLVYGVFRLMRIMSKLLPVIPNYYSSYLWAQKNNINHVFSKNINSPEIIEQIKTANPDLIISVSMNQIINKEILQIPLKKCINVHCAPLPLFAGMSPYVWVLAKNENHSAATIHYMEEGLDEGDIIVQKIVEVVEKDSAFALFYRCCMEARKLLNITVDQIENESVTSFQQDLSKRTYFSWPSKKCIKELYENDFRLATAKDFIEAIFSPNKLNGPSVFVTYGWCRSSYSVIQSLGRRGIDVHVGDDSALAMSRFSRYCKSFTKLPDFFIDPQQYFESTCNALKKTGAKVLMPGHEDVGIFSRRRDDLPSNVSIALPDWNNYSVAEDKFTALQVARETECPVPHTMEIGSLQELESLAQSTDWPVVIKTRIGNSAKGTHIAYGKKELVEQFKELFQTYNLPKERWPVIQEFLPGEAAGVCVLYDRGRCAASFAERYIRCKEPGRFGTSTFRETFDNHQLISQAISIMDRLEWHGVAHLDFVADKNGRFKLIEINPRLWGALALAMFSGVDFPYLWYLTAIGRNDMDSGIIQNRKVKCRWVVGDCLAFAELIKGGSFLEAFKLIIPQHKCYHDDFLLRDPLPLVFEICDYFTKFIKAGGSVNPVRGNMIR